MKLFVAASAVVASLFIGVAASAQHMVRSGAEVGAMHSRLHTIKINAQNDSGESGSATLQETSDGLVVKVDLTGATGDQPAHIHKGTCASLDPAPAYPLENLADGKSTTTLKSVTIYSLMRGTYAINVHKSTDDLKDYVACGDLTLTK